MHFTADGYACKTDFEIVVIVGADGQKACADRLYRNLVAAAWSSAVGYCRVSEEVGKSAAIEIDERGLGTGGAEIYK